MPWPIYSETFVYCVGAGVEVSYQVPDGYRAVVKSICARSYGAGAGLNVKVHGRIVCVFNFPAANTTQNLELMVVAYQRQTISAFTSSADVGVHVSGYLFKDETEAVGPLGEVTVAYVGDAPRPLPADSEAA